MIKALLIGVDYLGIKNRSIDYVARQLLEDDPTVSIKILNNDTLIKPTKRNIFNELNTLVDSAKVDDTIMFYYSGHEDQLREITRDEINKIILKTPIEVKFFIFFELFDSGVNGKLNNGIATKEFLKTVQDGGGFHKFFLKIFNDNLEYSQYVDSSINSALVNAGYELQSMVHLKGSEDGCIPIKNYEMKPRCL